MRIALVAIALFVAACDGPPAGEVTLTSLKRDVFEPRCSFSACHGGVNPARGLDLVTDTHGATVGVASQEDEGVLIVEAGNAAGSLLFQVMEADVGAVRQMPPGASVGDDILARVEAWIDGGAPND